MSEFENFEFTKQFSAARVKMLVIASALIPFLLNIHSTEKGEITILGTKFDPDKFTVVLMVWAATLLFFWLVFLARFIEESSRARLGVNDLKKEIEDVSKAQQNLTEFGESLNKFESWFEKYNLAERLEDIREGGRLEIIARDIQAASEKLSQAKEDFYAIPLTTDQDIANPDFKSETVQALNNSFGDFWTYHGDTDSILRDWQDFVDLYRTKLNQALSAEEMIQGLSKIQKFREKQRLAVKFRWIGMDAWTPLAFGGGVLIWVGIRIYLAI